MHVVVIYVQLISEESLSAVISKVFELAILTLFADYFQTSDQQFGFKKNKSCNHAVYNARNVIDYYVSRKTTSKHLNF